MSLIHSYIYLFIHSFIQVLFDSNGCIHRYTSVEDILKDFFVLRLDYYKKRKDYLLGVLGAESSKLSNQARFIKEKCDNTIVIGERLRASVFYERGGRRGGQV